MDIINLIKLKRSFFEEENQYYTVIEKDFYGISRRIKRIDKSLCLVYNALNGKYEIHDLRNTDSTFVLSAKDIDKEILNLLNASKDSNTISRIKDSRAKNKKYLKRKQAQRSEDNKQFALHYTYNTTIK